MLKNIDRGLLELLGPLGITRVINVTRIAFYKLNTSYIYHYLFIFLTSIFLILILVFKTYFNLDLEIFLILFLASFKILFIYKK